MILSEQVLKESLFADWLSDAGDAGSLDIPTKEIEKEVRKIIKKALCLSQAEVENAVGAIEKRNCKLQKQYGKSEYYTGISFCLLNLKERLLVQAEAKKKDE